MRTSLTLLSVAGLAAMMATGANAVTITFTDAFGLPTLRTTDWTQNLSVQRFDTSLGTLNSVDLLLEGSLLQNYNFESLDAQPTTVTAARTAVVSLTGAPGGPLSINNNGTDSYNVSAFDNVIDFDGASGRTPADFTKSDSVARNYTLPGDLAFFTGVGNLLFPTSASGTVVFTGSGNLLSAISTSGGARITVAYNYTPNMSSVPEPGSVALLVGAGTVGLGLLRRRRK